MSNVKIDFIVVNITVIPRRSLSDSAGPFWQPTEFENVANPYFENIKHLKNPGHLSLTAPIIGSLYNNQPHIFPPYYKTNITGVYRTLYSISNHQPTIDS